MPVLNETAFIQKSLGAVLAQTYPSELLEILVVDGGSTDNTKEIVQRVITSHPKVRLLDNPRRIQAAAMNIGILAARGDIVIRVDGHTIIAPDYVAQCVRCLTEGKAENVGGLMRPKGTTYFGCGIAIATTSVFGVGNSKFHYSEREQYVDTVYLGAYRRQTVTQIGLYDEFFRINEDYELNYRLRQAGGRILLSPSINSTYTPRVSLPALWRQYYRYGRWKVRALQKHPASLRWRQTVAPLFVAMFFFSLILTLVWPSTFLLFGVVAGSYLPANLLASTITAKRSGWKYLPILPVVFGAIHFAWGMGFWDGLARVAFKAVAK